MKILIATQDQDLVAALLKQLPECDIQVVEGLGAWEKALLEDFDICVIAVHEDQDPNAHMQRKLVHSGAPTYWFQQEAPFWGLPAYLLTGAVERAFDTDDEGIDNFLLAIELHEA